MDKYINLKSKEKNALVWNFLKFYTNPNTKHLKKNLLVLSDQKVLINKQKQNNRNVIISFDVEEENLKDININSFFNQEDATSWINFVPNRLNLTSKVNAIESLGFKKHAAYPGMQLLTDTWNVLENTNKNLETVILNSKNLAKVFQGIISETFDDLTIDIEKYIPIYKYSKKRNVNCQMLVKFENNLVGTGSIYFEDEYAVIDDISILEQFRGIGAAKHIMNYLISVAKIRGYKKVLLFATSEAIEIYRKLGFKEIDLVMEVYYKGI